MKSECVWALTWPNFSPHDHLTPSPCLDQVALFLFASYRFHNLVARYGRLEPLADVDLRPLSCVQVELHFEDNTEQLELRLKQTVADLKKQLRPVVQLPVNKMRVYYIDRQLGYALAPQELKYGARALHSYSIRDGDEILVVPKGQWIKWHDHREGTKGRSK